MFQGGGGGFGAFGGTTTPSYGGGFNGAEQSFTSPGGSKKPQIQGKVSSVMPVTVAMMMKASHDANDDVFKYADIEIHMVTFIGIIRDITEATTSITYKVDDYTGPYMSVRKFITEGEEDTSALPRNNGYVRIYGHLRSLGDTRNVIAFSVRSLSTHNEITSHILQVALAHLNLKNANRVGDKGIVAASNGNHSNIQTNMGMSPAQYQVFEALKMFSSQDRGVSILEITKSVNGMLNVTQIRAAIDFLSNEGHIYSTVDDEHYKLTDAC